MNLKIWHKLFIVLLTGSVVLFEARVLNDYLFPQQSYPEETEEATVIPLSSEIEADIPPEIGIMHRFGHSFSEIANCIGLKDGEIPRNGVLVGFYTNKSHSRMLVWYLDPRSGKFIGKEGDTSGLHPLVTYPQGHGGGFGKTGIYAIQVQPHYSNDEDTHESRLTARGDVHIPFKGSDIRDIWRNNFHEGEYTGGCLGGGSRKLLDGFMRELWITVRGSEKPDDYKDKCSQAKGGCYNKHRVRNTVLLIALDADTCLEENCFGRIVQTLRTKKGYEYYDPLMINFTTEHAISYW